MRMARGLATVVLALVAVGAVAPPAVASGSSEGHAATGYAQAFEGIPTYTVTITINDDGRLTIREVIDYDFGVVAEARDLP